MGTVPLSRHLGAEEALVFAGRACWDPLRLGVSTRSANDPRVDQRFPDRRAATGVGAALDGNGPAVEVSAQGEVPAQHAHSFVSPQ
ncbi:protein of unknown function [Micropruina glycogenica]|uniref:Uncharacterized protein n=1 Tax=Micropruina glycogenica TaxID=75385 RepID=A0A2N9JK04_9ACTN|nr:protein of unknown function [Micropruina glycogenica]